MTKHMTKEQAIKFYKEEILPSVKKQYESDGIIDKPARQFAWQIYIDGLCKDGEISQRQYDTWGNP